MSDQRTRNRIKSLKVEEVSLVDRPANSAARFVLAKRDDIDEHEGESVAKNAELEEITDEDLDAIEAELVELESELAESDDEIDSDSEEEDDDSEYDSEDDEEEVEEDEEEEEEEEVEKAHTLFNSARARTSIWPMINALQESVTSIVNDEDADTKGKQSALSKTISQFEAEAKRLLGEAESVTKNHEEDRNNMGHSTTLEKRLTELHDRNVELEKSLSNLVEARELEKREQRARAILGKEASSAEVTQLANILKNSSEEDAKFIEKMAKEKQELRKSSRIFEEIGSARGASAGVSTVVDQAVLEIQKNNPKLTRAQAIAKAYQDLGDEAYLAEDED